MKTIEIKDINELRNLLSENSTEPLVVDLKKEIYETESNINIKRCNVTINGNGAVLKGSRKIFLSDCTEENGIFKIDLKRLGISSGEFGLGNSWGLNYFSNYTQLLDEYTVKFKENSFGTPLGPTSWDAKHHGPGMEVFFDGQPMKLTRYPENGSMHIKQSFQLPDVENYDKKLGDYYAENNGEFIPDDNNFSKFKMADKALLVGNWKFEWATQKHAIDKIDSEKNIIKVKTPYHGYGYSVGAPFYALNVFEMLESQIGSWFIDRENELLYIHPYDGQDHIEISVCDNIFIGKNLSDLSFNNLNLSQCRFSAYNFENSKNISVDSVIIKNVGDYAVVGINCTNFSVDNCKIESSGGGITLHGGDNENLISSNNEVSNTEITKIGRWQAVYMPAIDITGVGVKIIGNYIHDIPHAAIIYSGNNHIIERNEITRFCTETNDAGAIYCGRNNSYYGVEINYNYIHDSQGLDGKGINALYFDDFSSSATCIGNIIANVTSAVQLGGGHDYLFMHNVFSNCDFFMIDSRGKIWFDLESSTILDNLKHLKKSDYKNDAWKKAFPKLYNADVESEEFLLPYGNRIIENTFIDCGGIYYQSKHHDLRLIEIKDNTFMNRKEIDLENHYTYLGENILSYPYDNTFENNTSKESDNKTCK